MSTAANQSATSATGRLATTSKYNIRQGRTCFGGTRLPVDYLFTHIAEGGTIDGFLRNYDHVEREQVITAIKRAGALIVARGRDRKRYMRDRRERMRVAREMDNAIARGEPIPTRCDETRSLAGREL